jgi:hypothetical protein
VVCGLACIELFDKALRANLRHDLIRVVDALAALKAERRRQVGKRGVKERA